ncbi:IclR family transcriptional regulator [Frigidibacter sp. SD6-1]|uniref:IclR family transcriptional regulator n=1 Tax=Frigidibacter sp. SD6-1 TaxID=3032581 RepID=UPI0024DFF4F7|nr:IclR family transcriptional regulator [Frigidibacter sp. SD6-1]
MGSEGHADGTVGKALDVLEMVADQGGSVRFSELLAISRYPKATLYRLLQTLVNQGMLTQDADSGAYALGVRLVRLAHNAWAHSSLAPLARPHLDALAAEVGEAIHLAQIDSGHILFVDKRKSTDMFETLAQAGRVAPAYCTGVGKAILAFLPDAARDKVMPQQSFHPYTPATHTEPASLMAELEVIRAEGVAFDREEHERGIISIAAPIRSRSGRVIGAVSIATSTSRHTLEELNALKPRLLQCAEAVGAEAETWQFPETN